MSINKKERDEIYEALGGNFQNSTAKDTEQTNKYEDLDAELFASNQAFIKDCKQIKKDFESNPINKLIEAAREPFEVRALDPETSWRKTLLLNLEDNQTGKETFDQYLPVIKETAINTGSVYSLIIEDKNDRLNVTQSRYPRRAFGPVPSIDTYEANWTTLSINLEQARQTMSEYPSDHDFNQFTGKYLRWGEEKPAITDDQEKTPDVRMVMGLNEGYGENAVTHTIEEVKAVLTTLSGEGNFNVELATIVAVGPNQDGTTWEYTEPAVVITGALENIHYLYALLHAFKQSRAAIESDWMGKTWMVETKHCTDPDKE